MKNIITLTIAILFTIIATNLFAQDTQDPEWVKTTEQVGSLVTDATSTVIEGTKELTSDLYEGAKTVISDLARALEVPAEYVYRILVRQQVVEALSSLIGATVLIIVGSFVTFKMNKNYFSSDDWEIDENALPVVAAVISLIALVAGITWILTDFKFILSGLINPEYGAMKDIVNMIGTATGK